MCIYTYKKAPIVPAAFWSSVKKKLSNESVDLHDTKKLSKTWWSSYDECWWFPFIYCSRNLTVEFGRRAFKVKAREGKCTESNECPESLRNAQGIGLELSTPVWAFCRESVVKETGILNIFSLLFALAPFIFSLIFGFVACNCSIRRNISV